MPINHVMEADVDRLLEREISYNKEILTKFSTDVLSNATQAFEWGGNVIMAAARHDTATMLRGMLKQKGIGYVVDFLTTYVLEHAQWLPRTAQPIANLVQSETLAAYARYGIEISTIIKKNQPNVLVTA